MSKKTEQSRNSIENFPIVGIGASAGGLDAMKILFENLQENIGLAYVVIQHLASDQESMLSEILARYTNNPVNKVQNGMQIKPNNVYVIPSGKTMSISKGTLKLEPKIAPSRPINDFMKSLANNSKTLAIGVVLSGTGNDGTEGLKAIKEEGGITFAQDPKTAHYPDMPRNAIQTETVYYVLSPKNIAEELVNIATHPNMDIRKQEIKEPTKEDLSDDQKIFTRLKATFGVNFTHYKKSTVNRRITRRMVINRINSKKEYIEFLRKSKEELEALFNDLLIGVTSFFREPDTFTALKEKVFPELIDKKQLKEIIRVWIPGCSTGEEVYSIAITIEEYLEEKNIVNKQIQIFGTDVSDKNIEKARQAVYPKIIEENVSEKRLDRYFTLVNADYKIKKQIRDMCVFAKHDLTLDPPFSNLDMIVCRNLLIYFDNELQEKTIPVFHYGLKNYGYLVLGQSESIGSFTDLFKPLTKKGLIFQKKLGHPTAEFQLGRAQPSFTAKKRVERLTETDSLKLFQKEMDNILLTEHVSPSLLLDDNMNVVVFRGEVDNYITIDSGIASLKAIKIIRKDLRATLQTILFKAKQTKKEITQTLRTKSDKQTQLVQIQIKPIKFQDIEDFYYLVIFNEAKVLPTTRIRVLSEKEIDSAKDQQIKELSQDLTSTKETLKTVIEQHDAINEELRSTLEEAQSSNEELMSTNEELETTKEELQSANEELTTLNDELKDRNQKLFELNNDLNNLMNNVDTAVIMVDNDFKIRRFTDSAVELLKLSPTDLDSSITKMDLGIPIINLEKLLDKSVNELVTVREEIETKEGSWHQMRIKPYLTDEKKVEGAVLSFADVTEMKKLEKENRSHTEDLEQKVKDQTCELVASERLSTIGKTAGMVGHDIRNPLQAMEGELYLAKQELKSMPYSKEKDRMMQSIENIQDRLYYINKIVADLQDYARKINIVKEHVNLQDIVNDVLLTIPIPKLIKVEVKMEPGLSEVYLDETYLRRILVNLITNAVQAMPKGGTLTIKIIRQDEEVVINIIDTGEGISKEAKKKLFTPLFTTKSKGMGFGLAVVKKMTEAMEGTITFESKENEGSKFSLTFPMKSKKL